MDKIKRVEISVISTVVFVVVSLITFFIAAKWPLWWKWINLEKSPMTKVEYSIILLTAFTTTCCLILAYISGETKKAIIYWAVISLAFYVFAADEIFALHEALRDKVLAPNDVSIPLFFWTSPGDFVLLLVFVVGLFFLPELIKLLSERRVSLILFICAVVVAGIAISIDSLDFHSMKGKSLNYEQFAEELLETTAQLLFFSSFFLIFTGKLRKLPAKDR